MKHLSAGRRYLTVVVLALALSLSWAWTPATLAIDDSGGETAETVAPTFDLWSWILDLFGMGNVTAASSDTDSTELTEEPTLEPTLGLLPENTLEGGIIPGDDDDEVGAIDPEG